jgi:hypothetical protein
VAAADFAPILLPHVERPPRFAYEERAPPSADLGDILHVPIAVLA